MTTKFKSPKWRDATSYSRNDTERTPRTWALDLGDAIGLGDLFVTRHIHEEPHVWRMILSTHSRPLRSVELKDAQNEALSIVESALKDTLEVVMKARTP